MRIPSFFIAATTISLACLTSAAAASPPPAAVTAAPDNSDIVIARAIEDEAGGALKRFYRTRGYRPLWVSHGRIGASAATLIGYLSTAKLDGLARKSYDPDKLAAAVEKARDGDPRDIARAELKLSDAFADYVRDQRRPDGDVAITYADRALKPRKLKVQDVLRAAAFPSSFADYVAAMGWMSAEYVRLRRLMAHALVEGAPADDVARLRLNMDRARVLPSPWTRHIVVDASSGRLWYYEAGKQVGTMRVVVGAEATQTPMLVGQVQWAILDPYWNVPTYLARGSIARKVLSGRSLAAMHMQALSGWGESAQVIPAASIDWHAVADGSAPIRLRQLPGPFNSMGRIKFVFPNDDGIYLHDTPERDLLRKDDRHFSNGCIRLENATALGKWLLGGPIPKRGEPEQAIALPVPVPVYLTYITAAGDGKQLAFRPDIYGRDAKAG